MSIKKCMLFIGVVLALAGLALGQGIETRNFVVGTQSIWWFANVTGQTVTTLQIAFDQPVKLLGKVEVFGGMKNITGMDTGTEFLFHGTLANHGFIELRWEPVEAQPTLVMWLVGERPAGVPYFTTVPALIKVLSGGLAALRDADPAGFTSLLQTFFRTNPTLADSLGQLGLTPELITGMLMAAPVEGIENLLLTLVGAFGLDTLDEFMGALDWSLILGALGL